MCVYCMIGDHAWKFDPPWYPSPPLVPAPMPQVPQKDWPVERLREYLDLLKQVKALEDQIGCPCEPSKADHIGLFEKRIGALENKAKLKRAAQSKIKIR